MGFKLLVRGIEGALGHSFCRLLEDQPITILRDSSHIDSLNAVALSALFEEQAPHLVLNLKQNVDTSSGKRPDPEVATLVGACKRAKIPMLHVSSYSVFGDGYEEAGFKEGHVAKPGTAEGKLLLANEREVSKLENSLIVRSSWILNGDCHGLLSSLVPRLLSEDTIVVSDHRSGGPISVDFLCKAIIAMVQQILTGANNWGVYHLHSADLCSEAEFCDHLIRALQKELEREIAFPEVAAKDDDRCVFEGCAKLLGRRCTDDFGIQLPTWRRGFASLLRAWLEEHKAEIPA